MTKAFEINFDGLVGPTHNYAGLALGNVASSKHRHSASHPKTAALQGLEKMKTLRDWGIPQAVLPPHERPHLPTLRALGFTGSDEEIISRAAKESPVLLANVSSASPMWTANAGTMSPSPDTTDNRAHFTPANMAQFFHHTINHQTTHKVFSAIFKDADKFAVHDALPPTAAFGDEGAANHTRFCPAYEKPGLEFFVFGRSAFDSDKPTPQKFPGGQTLEASQAIARRHKAAENRVFFAQQNPDVIDAGVFHNDVVAVGNQNVLFCHELAFLDQPKVLADLKKHYRQVCQDDLIVIEVPQDGVSIEDAVCSYLFNTQLITLPDQTMALVAPQECFETPSVKAYLDALMTQNTPIKRVNFVDVRQSMQNGGGPACLRFRVTLTENEMKACAPGVFLNDALYDALKAWINKHYRDEIRPPDILDPSLYRESCKALDELSQILGLGSIYPFQLVR